jgi:competence/damage-inducible protein CinA C-terminal domain
MMKIPQHKVVTLQDNTAIDTLTNALGTLLTERGLRLTTAESCTGGKLASALCASSDTPEFYGVGFITFTNEAKSLILGVQKSTLDIHTAVSEAVVAEMAVGAQKHARVDVSIAVSGYGGPEGGEDGTPPGTVWFALAIHDTVYTVMQHFVGECEEVLDQAVRFAVAQLLALLRDEK